MMRVCHVNTCPVGVATQDPILREKFSGKPEYVENFMRFIAQEVREILAELGFRSLDEIVGRTDLLEIDTKNELIAHRGIDLGAILAANSDTVGIERRFTRSHPIDLSETLDEKILLDYCSPAIDAGMAVSGEFPISNTDRSVGTRLGNAVSRKHGANGLEDNTVRLHFRGSAGQSFGAFVPKGISLTLEGDSNDYLGKGLSGGRIVVFPPRESTFPASENVIIGNTVLYGATSGEVFVSGIAGERFAVRNSGALAVVEGVGDHGCEYMTGGTVIVLGTIGKNFAAGMSGGTAYIYDAVDQSKTLINRELVEFAELEPFEEEHMRSLIERHTSSTGSFVGADILHDWDNAVKKFLKVIPTNYRRVLELQKRYTGEGLTTERAAFAAFETMTATA
jgi:glutamate synthase (ferredoxin)